MKKLNKKGFTLVEMLVVIAIIAVLVAIIVPTVSSSTGKAKAATDAANLRSAQATATIKVLEGSTATSFSASELGVPDTSKSKDGGAFTCTVSGEGTGITVECKYGSKTIDDFTVAAGGTSATTTSAAPKDE